MKYDEQWRMMNADEQSMMTNDDELWWRFVLFKHNTRDTLRSPSFVCLKISERWPWLRQGLPRMLGLWNTSRQITAFSIMATGRYLRTLRAERERERELEHIVIMFFFEWVVYDDRYLFICMFCRLAYPVKKALIIRIPYESQDCHQIQGIPSSCVPSSCVLLLRRVG